MEHETRREQKYFVDLLEGRMNFLPVKAVKNFQVGDEIVIKESLPGEWVKDGHYQPGSSEKLTGREIRRKVTYIFDQPYFGLAPGYVVLGFEAI